jgi:threonyl-tRNA synthetase
MWVQLGAQRGLTYTELRSKGIRVELVERNEKVGYKIRDWETQKVPYMLIVGEKEVAESQVSVRKHKSGDLGKMSLSEFSDKIYSEIKNKIQ